MKIKWDGRTGGVIFYKNRFINFGGVFHSGRKKDMSEFSNIMERIKTEKLAEYLLYGSASDREREDFYENSIENSYNEIFNKLAEIYPVTDGEKEKLYEAVMDFSIIQSEIYFEMGLSAGFHLYKNFDSVSRNRKTDGSDSGSL